MEAVQSNSKVNTNSDSDSYEVMKNHERKIRDEEAVDFSAATATSVSVLPIPRPNKRSYFISSYPTHECGSG